MQQLFFLFPQHLQNLRSGGAGGAEAVLASFCLYFLALGQQLGSGFGSEGLFGLVRSEEGQHLVNGVYIFLQGSPEQGRQVGLGAAARFFTSATSSS